MFHVKHLKGGERMEYDKKEMIIGIVSFLVGLIICGIVQGPIC